MKFGLLPQRLIGTPADTNPPRPYDEWFQELEAMLQVAEKAGFAYVGMPGMQSLLHFARYAAIPSKLLFANETLTLPMLDPVQLAPAAAQVDQMLAGRLIFGVSIGYYPSDLDAAGITRKERVPKFEESLQIIKAMWTQDEVSFHGKYFDFSGLRPTIKPYQQPHPPIVISSHAHGSAKRAGRLGDGICLGPAALHEDVTALADTFRQAYFETNNRQPGYVGAWRDCIAGPNPREASIQGSRNEDYLQFSPRHRYVVGQMQESTGVRLHLEPVQDDATDFAFCGSHQDMVEQIGRFQEKTNLTHMTCSFFNCPRGFEARLEYLQAFGEEVVSKFPG